MRSRWALVALSSSFVALAACRVDEPLGRASNAMCGTSSSTSGAGGATCAPAPQCAADADCGAATSGKVCVDQACVAGCRGTSGNACPTGQICSSINAVVGTCAPAQMTTSSSGGPAGDDVAPIGGGCSTTPRHPVGGEAAIALAAWAFFGALTRRRAVRSKS